MKYAPYSHGRLNMARCRMAFKKKYIDELPEIKGPNTEFGSITHRVFEKIMRARVEEEEYDVREIIESCSTDGVTGRSGELYDIVEKFVNYFRVDPTKVAGIEEKLAVDADGNPMDFHDDGAYFRGIIDLLEIEGDRATITDYKTQFNILNQEDMDKNVQLSRYCWLVSKHFPQIKEFTVRIYFARYGATRTSERTLEDIEKTGVEIDLSIKEVEKTEVFGAIPSDVCLYCGYSESCPFVTGAVDYDPGDVIIDETDAQEVASHLVAMKARIKKLDKSLRDYCAENGKVVVSDDYSYGFVDKKASSFDPQRVLDVIMAERPEDVLEVVSVPVTRVDKYIKKMRKEDPEIASSLEALREYTIKTDFKGFKDA